MCLRQDIYRFLSCLEKMSKIDCPQNLRSALDDYTQSATRGSDHYTVFLSACIDLWDARTQLLDKSYDISQHGGVQDQTCVASYAGMLPPYPHPPTEATFGHLRDCLNWVLRIPTARVVCETVTLVGNMVVQDLVNAVCPRYIKLPLGSFESLQVMEVHSMFETLIDESVATLHAANLVSKPRLVSNIVTDRGDTSVGSKRTVLPCRALLNLLQRLMERTATGSNDVHFDFSALFPNRNGARAVRRRGRGQRIGSATWRRQRACEGVPALPAHRQC